MMLGTSPDHVVVRILSRARSLRPIERRQRRRGRRSGASCRKAVGKPVRVQWMRADDLQWSTQSPAAFSDVQIGLDEKGKMAAYQIDHYMPAMQDDRPVGAVLAGLPTMPAPNEKAISSAPRSTTLPIPGSTTAFRI